MAKAKKKLLPKDFEALLKTNSVDQLKKLFDTCDINARGGYSKQTAMAFNQCPDELVRWLIENGADINAADIYGYTPLHSRSSGWNGRIEILLELGADINHGENKRGTPLHTAAGQYRVEIVDTLLRHGARIDALNRERQTPLEYALQRCENSDIQDMAEIAELLLKAGARKTEQMKVFVNRIGSDFEFHRNGFNRKLVTPTSKALDKLYVMFGVPPIPPRLMHDGKSPIVARSKKWKDQYQELWELLVPSSGAARTVQGEVVRIAGRIHDEIYRNGGCNWDGEYKKMAKTFLMHIASGVPLSKSLLTEAHSIVAGLKRQDSDSGQFTQACCSVGITESSATKTSAPGLQSIAIPVIQGEL